MNETESDNVTKTNPNGNQGSQPDSTDSHSDMIEQIITGISLIGCSLLIILTWAILGNFLSNRKKKHLRDLALSSKSTSTNINSPLPSLNGRKLLLDPDDSLEENGEEEAPDMSSDLDDPINFKYYLKMRKKKARLMRNAEQERRENLSDQIERTYTTMDDGTYTAIEMM